MFKVGDIATVIDCTWSYVYYPSWFVKNDYEELKGKYLQGTIGLKDNEKITVAGVGYKEEGFRIYGVKNGSDDIFLIDERGLK